MTTKVLPVISSPQQQISNSSLLQSQLSAITPAELSNASSPATTTPSTPTAPSRASSTAGSTLYEGTKSYWRTRTNVDFSIIEHPLLATIEVISYNSDIGIEAPRLYINMPLLYSKISKDEVDTKVDLKKEEYVRQRKRVPYEELQQAITKELAVAYITLRMQVAPTNESSSGKKFEMQLIPMSGDTTVTDVITVTTSAPSAPSLEDNDNDDNNNCNTEQIITTTTSEVQRIDILMKTMPEGLEPKFIPRRRKTNISDFHNTLNALRTDSASLSHAMNKAQKASGLMAASITGFQANLSRLRVTFDPESMSMAKQRWMRAGRKVILQITVTKVRTRLERYSLSALPSESISSSGAALKKQLGISSSSMRPSQSTVKLPSLAPILSPRNLEKSNSTAAIATIGGGMSEGKSSANTTNGKNKISNATTANASSGGTEKLVAVKKPKARAQ